MKFVVGEIVQIWSIRHKVWGQGVVMHVPPYIREWPDCYCIMDSTERSNHITGEFAAHEWQLRKLPGDSIPASTLAIFAKKQPNPDKVKETERG